MRGRVLHLLSGVLSSTVRVKWYPNLETTKHWPAGIGELWTDAPVDCDGSVDLKAVMRRWGMQNCYVRIKLLIGFTFQSLTSC